MTFEEACEQLNKWVNLSQNDDITLPSGKSGRFGLFKKYSSQEIEQFEAKWNIALPTSYKYFLENVGAIYCFESLESAAIQFLKLEELEDFSKWYFEGRTNLFPEILIVGNLLSLGDDFGFNTTKLDSKNFRMILHDEDTEVYLTDEPSFCNFEDWIIQLVTTEGDEKYLFD